MTFDQWLVREGLTEAQAASRIGVTQATVNKYRHHRATPRTAIMQRIVAATGGAVTPNDFLPVAAPTPTDQVAA